MGFDSKSVSIRYQPQDNDTLDKVAERERTAENPLTGSDIAKFNWGTDDPSVIEEYLRDELGCYRKDPGGQFLISSDVDARSELLIPQHFRKTGLNLTKTHTIRIRKEDTPPKQFEACARLKGINFEYDKSFICPSVTDDLIQLENALVKHSDAKIVIFGHTDKVSRQISVSQP